MFDLGRDFTEEEIAFIDSQEKRNNLGNATSKDNRILNKAELQGIREFIEKSIAEYFDTVYAPKNHAKLRITQSWCNYTKPGQFHHKHAHSNSFISGVLYPKADKEVDRISFYKETYQQLKTPPREWNPYNSESWWMEAFTGRMFLFPSGLTHMVEMTKGDNTRVSLSFNTFPVGNFGDDQDLTGVDL